MQSNVWSSFVVHLVVWNVCSKFVLFLIDEVGDPTLDCIHNNIEVDLDKIKPLHYRHF